MLCECADAASIAAAHSSGIGLRHVDSAQQDGGVIEMALAVTGIFFVRSSFEDECTERVRNAEVRRRVREDSDRAVDRLAERGSAGRHSKDWSSRDNRGATRGQVIRDHHVDLVDSAGEAVDRCTSLFGNPQFIAKGFECAPRRAERRRTSLDVEDHIYIDGRTARWHADPGGVQLDHQASDQGPSVPGEHCEDLGDLRPRASPAAVRIGNSPCGPFTSVDVQRGECLSCGRQADPCLRIVLGS